MSSAKKLTVGPRSEKTSERAIGFRLERMERTALCAQPSPFRTKTPKNHLLLPLDPPDSRLLIRKGPGPLDPTGGSGLTSGFRG